MDPGRARRELVRGLALAAAGELGATLAYLGHRASLPHGPDRALIRGILEDEIRHRRIVLGLLGGLGARPDARSERKLRLVGRSISAFCGVGGWFLPMVGAARFECDNIVEYELLARLAHHAGLPGLVEPLLHLAETEWDHELGLRRCAARHGLWRLVPRWPVPPPRASIRKRYAAFVRRPVPVRRRFSLLVR